jgi:hypothetical protein
VRRLGAAFRARITGDRPGHHRAPRVTVFQKVDVVVPAVGVVFARTPEFADQVHVSVAVKVGGNRGVAAQVGVQDHAFHKLLALAVRILPKEPPRRPRAGNAFHLAGEDIRIAVVVEIGDDQRVVRAPQGRIPGGQLVGTPSPAAPVRVLQPGDSSALNLVFGHDQIVVAVAIDVQDRAVRGQRKRLVRIAEGDVFVGGPLLACPVDILEPPIRAHHVHVSIPIQVADSDAGMDRRADIEPLPGLTRILGNAIPAQVVPVRHGQDIGPPIAVQVGQGDVMDRSQLGIERDPLEQLRARLARVAVPRAAGHEVHPAVAVDVQGGAAHIGRRLFAQSITRPAAGALQAIPQNLAAAAAGDEIRPPVAVQIRHGRLPPRRTG